MAFYFCRPDEWWSLGATVATSSGTTDTDYTDDWIVDGRPGRPARATSGSVAWTLSASSGEVGLIAVCNSNISVNTVISGGVSATVSAGALGANGIRRNGFATVTPANITTLVATITSNPSDVILGELVAAKYRTLARGPVTTEASIAFNDFRLDPGAEFSSVMPYDRGLVARKLTGSNVYNAADLAILQGWWEAQKSGSLPSLIVPDSAVNDAWIVTWTKFSYAQEAPVLWRVEFEFVEYPRSRW